MYCDVTCSTSDGPFALNHRPHEVREISIGRHLLENRAQRRLGRVRARDFQSAELPLLVHHVNGTPVGDILNDQPSHGRQRLLVVERSRQRDADLSQKLLFLFDPLSLCDVLRDTEKINRVTRRVEDRNFFRMQDANALMARLYRFFRYVDDRCRVSGSRDLSRRKTRPVPVAKNRSRSCR